MHRCYARYVRPGALHDQQSVTVLDVGGADINGGYRQVFKDARYRYLTADLADGDGVDIVLEDPYRLPVEDGSVDIVLSGQMLEHCEFFWLAFAEMIRVLKPDGYLFMIAPSAGPIHRYPVDCYRFYPDAYGALAKYANCHLVEVWRDERGPWQDLVGVFAKQPVPVPAAHEIPRVEHAPIDPATVPSGTAEEEATRGGVHYLDVLASLHKALEPDLYLEIGVRHGRSLALAGGAAVAVDPAPDINVGPLPPTTRLLAMTSDDFFMDVAAEELAQPPGLVFIDGMHLFEYVLRDFMHVERLADPGTLVVVDDIYPSHPAQAERDRRTRVWTGDVWKLQQCLAKMRPDLFLLPLDTAPTGLLLIAGLDPKNRVLWDHYNPTVRQYSADQAPPSEVLERREAIGADSPLVAEVLAVLKQSNRAGTPRNQILASLRQKLPSGHGAK
jgi:hypothetical protein